MLLILTMNVILFYLFWQRRRIIKATETNKWFLYLNKIEHNIDGNTLKMKLPVKMNSVCNSKNMRQANSNLQSCSTSCISYKQQVYKHQNRNHTVDSLLIFIYLLQRVMQFINTFALHLYIHTWREGILVKRRQHYRMETMHS